MNKKGFAISVILYAVVFIIITIFYILLGIIKSRYSVSNDLRNSIFNDLNSVEHLYTKLDKDEPVSLLRVDPNGGSVEFDGNVITTPTFVVNYAGETIMVPDANRDNLVEGGNVFTVSYDANGGDSNPSSASVGATKTTEYAFDVWQSSGECGSFENGVYTFPSTYGSECTKTASWIPNIVINANNEITLASSPTRRGYYFIGWESSVDSEIYQAGSNYMVTQNTVMTAQWIEDVWAKDLSYSDIITKMNCEDVQCALDKIAKILSDIGNMRRMRAVDLSYDNSKTHLPCSDVQCAITELNKIAGK